MNCSLKAIKLLVFVLLLSLGSSWADEPRSSVASITWVTYDDEMQNKGEPAIKEMLEEVFHVPNERRFEVETAFPLSISDGASHSFEGILSEALASLSLKPKPELKVVVRGHGVKGALSRERRSADEPNHDISYKSFFEVLSRQVKAHSLKDLKISLYFSACYSGSAIPYAKQVVNELRPFTSAINVWTSASDNEVSWGHEFIEALIRANRMKAQGPSTCIACNLSLEQMRTYLSFGGRSSHQFWSSVGFQLPEKYTLAEFILLLKSADEFERKQALWGIQSLDKNGTEIGTVAEIVGNPDEEIDFRRDATEVLTGMAVTGNSVAITALKMASIDPDVYLRYRVAYGLAKIGGMEELPVLRRLLSEEPGNGFTGDAYLLKCATLDAMGEIGLRNFDNAQALYNELIEYSQRSSGGLKERAFQAAARIRSKSLMH